MTPKEFKAALAITDFVSIREVCGEPQTEEQQQRRNERLTELLYAFAAAVGEAHDAQDH
jgi:hypothetical protein